MDSATILSSDLVQRLKSIQDYRSSKGKRYPLWVMLLVCVLGVMSGAQGYQALEDFGQRHYTTLCETLGVSLSRMPSDTTLRRLFNLVDMLALTEQFTQWARSQFSPAIGECIAMDGKSLSSTLVGHTQHFQNFIGVVSAYSHQQRLVIGQQGYANQNESEIAVVQSLIETLGLSGVTFTFDALHCQKNTSAAS